MAAVRVGRVRPADRVRERRQSRPRARRRPAHRELRADGARRDAGRLVRQTLTESLCCRFSPAPIGLLFARIGTVTAPDVRRRSAPKNRDRAAGCERPALSGSWPRSAADWLPACCRRCNCRGRIRPKCLEKTDARALGGRSRRRLHSTLVVAEIALAVILLSGAGLLTRSFLRVQATDRGFSSENVLLLKVDLPGTYEQRRQGYRGHNDAIRRIRALPGVVAAGAVSDFFIHRQRDYRDRRGRPAGEARRRSRPAVDRRSGHPRLLRGDADALIRGRVLEDADLAPGAPPVSVINEEMARRFWPGEESLGKRLKYAPRSGVEESVEDRRRRRCRHAAAAPRRAGNPVHLPAGHQPGQHGHRHSRDQRRRTACGSRSGRSCAP